MCNFTDASPIAKKERLDANKGCPSRRMILVGVAGASGSGKTTLAKELAQQLASPLNVCSADHYLDIAKVQRVGSWETPAGIAWEDMRNDLQRLTAMLERDENLPCEFVIGRRGARGPLELVRSGRGGTPLGTEPVVIVIEGYLLFHDKELCKMLDVALWIEADCDTCASRRCNREGGGRMSDAWCESYHKNVWKDYELYRGEQLANVPKALHLDGSLQPEALVTQAASHCREAIESRSHDAEFATEGAHKPMANTEVKTCFETDGNPGKITTFYDIDKEKLGEGSYGTVSKCTNKSTGAVRAVKSTFKSQMKNMERFKQEIAILKIMDHPNIIKLFDSFEDHHNIYLILELCSGGELVDRIIDAGHFTEAQASTVMQHMFRAIFYMHENHICHRDLKPENFLFATREPIEKSALKLIDFGSACKFAPDQVLLTKVGTPYYVAPQVLAGKYDQSADMWSLGVIMYVVLCGYPPFYGETDADVLAKVRLGNYCFIAADWKNLSEDARHLIRLLLKLNPRDRYTAEQALNHAWVRNKAPQAAQANAQSTLVDNLRGFRSQNRLKKAALHVTASQCGETQIKQLRDTLMALDGHSDGLLTAASQCPEAKNSSSPDAEGTTDGAENRRPSLHKNMLYHLVAYLSGKK
jgi:serine/threonine protein kinase/uridine kinase